MKKVQRLNGYGREKVNRLDDGQLIADSVYSGVVAGLHPHQQVGIAGAGEHVCQGAQNLRQGRRAPLGSSTSRSRHGG